MNENIIGGIGTLILSILMFFIGEGTALILTLPIGVACTVAGVKEKRRHSAYRTVRTSK